MPVDVPSSVTAENSDVFQHVEAVMKEGDVSTVGLDSQDGELLRALPRSFSRVNMWWTSPWRRRSQASNALRSQTLLL